MPKTKTTPRKVKEVCPLCFIELSSRDAWKEHLVQCASNVIQCKECHVSFKKKAYLAKHMRQKHPNVAQETDPPVESSSYAAHVESSDWDEDPGELIGNVSESEGEADNEEITPSTLSDPISPVASTPKTTDETLLLGRIFRKRSQPAPLARRVVRVHDSDHEDESSGPTFNVTVSRPELVETEVQVNSDYGDASAQTEGPEMRDAGTQCAKYRKRVKEVTVTKYQEGGRNIEIIRECEEFFNM